MENKTKAETYVGFAIRKGSYKIGVNAINTLKRAKLLIVCRTAGNDTARQAKKLAKRFNCRLLQTVKTDLSQIVYREKAKLLAITDEPLALAVINGNDDEFIEEGLGE